jgi:hypothetical protein
MFSCEFLKGIVNKINGTDARDEWITSGRVHGITRFSLFLVGRVAVQLGSRIQC